jgi:uncharacterized protein (TIGR01244 family)
VIDLDALALPNAILIAPGVVSAGQPDAHGYARAHSLGMRRVLNLRPASETPAFDSRASAEASGLVYANLPIAGVGDLSRENAAALDRWLAEAAGAPVLVHCGSGVRVCALLALRAYWLQDASADEALAIAARAGITPILGALRQLMQG